MGYRPERGLRGPDAGCARQIPGKVPDRASNCWSRLKGGNLLDPFLARGVKMYHHAFETQTSTLHRLVHLPACSRRGSARPAVAFGKGGWSSSHAAFFIIELIETPRELDANADELDHLERIAGDSRSRLARIPAPSSASRSSSATSVARPCSNSAPPGGHDRPSRDSGSRPRSWRVASILRGPRGSTQAHGTSCALRGI